MRNVVPWILALAVVTAAGVAAGQTVAVVTTSPAGNSAARYLASQIDYPVSLRTSRYAAETDALIAEARASWKEDLVVVIDADRAVIRVVRPRDGTVASRPLDPATASAPYAVSLAAAELLELVINAPPARAAPPPARAPAPPPQKTPETPPVVRWRSNVALWGGALLSLSQNGDVGLLQPIVGTDLQLKRPPSSIWYSIGANFAGVVSTTQRQLIILPDGSDEEGTVNYRRDHAAARAGVGHRQASGCAFGFAEVSAARISVTARDERDRQLRNDSRWAILVGVGVELRYALGKGFFAGIGGGLSWLPSARHFYASPEGSPVRIAAFRESPFEFRAQPITLLWESDP